MDHRRKKECTIDPAQFRPRLYGTKTAMQAVARMEQNTRAGLSKPLANVVGPSANLFSNIMPWILTSGVGRRLLAWTLRSVTGWCADGASSPGAGAAFRYRLVGQHIFMVALLHGCGWCHGSSAAAPAASKRRFVGSVWNYLPAKKPHFVLLSQLFTTSTWDARRFLQ